MSNKQRLEKETAARRLEAERLAVKAREKEVLDKQQNALRRQKEFREKTQIWNEQILPRWHDLFQGDSSSGGFGWTGLLGSGRSAKVRDLCHKGIPPNIRGKVWPLMIRNDLKVKLDIVFNEHNLVLILQRTDQWRDLRALESESDSNLRS